MTERGPYTPDLFSPPVSLEIRWPDLFRREMSPAERHARWEEWKSISFQAGAGEQLSYWTEAGETCGGCVHRAKDWCDLQGLPCNVNPILTLRHGMIGMACMGAGAGYDKAKKTSSSQED